MAQRDDLVPVSLEPSPVIEAYKRDVDRTLLRENLKLTPDERMRKMIAALRFHEEVRLAQTERVETMTTWYELWADEGLSPPYVLIVEPTETGFRVTDPAEKARVVFEAATYDEVKLWLLEDEYVKVSGRMELEP